jgi:hypothetical protein
MRKILDLHTENQNWSWRIITDEEIDLLKFSTSLECKNWILAESSTLLKSEGTRYVGEPHLRWLESVEEGLKNMG